MVRRALAYLSTLLALIWPVAALSEGRVIEMDFRIVLAQLAQKVGANGQIAILQAQGADPAPAIVVQGGALSLDDIALQAGAALEQTGEGSYTLRRPLLVWNDSTLEISEALNIDGANGAFLAVLGGLRVEGGSIRAMGDAPAIAPDNTPDNADNFHPFVLVAGQGYLVAHAAHFENLGFGSIPAFAGVALINRGIFPPLAESKVTESAFSGNGTLSLLSVEDAEITRNTFEAHRGNGLTLRASKNIRISDNKVTGAGGHGLRISEGSENVLVEANVILGSARTGMLVDRRSIGVALLGNEVRGARASGLQVDGAFCVQLARNAVSEGQGAGITIRRSAYLDLSQNAVTGNRGAGIALSAQPKAVATSLHGNLLAYNRVGLSGKSAGELELEGNDFTDQFPRFLDGDLTRDTPRLARNLAGKTPMTFAGAYDSRPVILPECTLPGDA